MPLKESKGNMYDWVTHMHTHLAGECPHKCSYCYVQKNRFGVSPRYQGVLRFVKHELNVHYGEGKTIFIEHMNDMFAKEMQSVWIENILQHCRQHPNNVYIFQTKNPSLAAQYKHQFPQKYMIGTTIESNREYMDITKAPTPQERYEGLLDFKDAEKFITIEPILDFDVDTLVEWISNIQPSFINIGADSKQCSLPEPSRDKVNKFISELQKNKITIKKKVNLTRLMGY